MVDAVLIDAGGVLFNNISEETDFLDRLARRYGADPALLPAALDERDAAYEVGRAHVHDVLRDALVAAGAPADLTVEPDWLDAQYLDCLVAHAPAFTMLAELREHRPDLRLVLANNEAAHWDRVKDGRHGHLGLVDVIASSWQVGRVKPSAEFFAAVSRSCGHPLDRSLLIDDNPEVLAAAERLGLHVLHAASPAALPGQVARRLSYESAAARPAAL
ncbi:HAD family hydrolase [Kitasatospora purpeofusca]|uniref:HAD family hydrolase n=1 Tax=Kitasatospora purpeofusca TaxID=67352 RepID=UPI0035D87119